MPSSVKLVNMMADTTRMVPSDAPTAIPATAHVPRDCEDVSVAAGELEIAEACLWLEDVGLEVVAVVVEASVMLK